MIRDHGTFSIFALFVVISLAGIAWTMLTGNFSVGAEQDESAGIPIRFF